jgi:predicted RNA-binding Zn-ribbon protein involved in translation (DUF1610 family)
MKTKKCINCGKPIIKKKKCPKCGEEIDYLISEATATTGVTMNMDGKMSFDNEDMNDIAETNEWECPKCDEVIAMNEEEALNFMRGKNENKK